MASRTAWPRGLNITGKNRETTPDDNHNYTRVKRHPHETMRMITALDNAVQRKRPVSEKSVAQTVQSDNTAAGQIVNDALQSRWMTTRSKSGGWSPGDQRVATGRRHLPARDPGYVTLWRLIHRSWRSVTQRRPSLMLDRLDVL